MSALLRALSTPRRREILRLVWDRERSAGEIHRSFGDVTFGAVSQHLRVLEEAGLVASRSEGRNRYYRARREELGPLAEWLESMWDSALDRLARASELEAARRGPRPRRRRTSSKNEQTTKPSAKRKRTR
jgi:DNA-binding transcriptional ArsR family regulator